MDLIKIKDKNKYNNFIARQRQSQFLQSWEWGEFNKGVGFDVERFGVERNGELVLVFSLIKKSLGLGKNYWYCPRGDLTNGEFEVLNFLFFELYKLAKKKNIIFLRFEPIHKLNYKNLKFQIKRTLDVQPSRTLILDISRPKEELLWNFKQKTRYNVRLAKKRGVKIREMKNNDDFEKWWKIMNETKKRDRFRLHSKNYYKNMLEISFVKLFLAEYGRKIIAGNIISFFGDMATYAHGASSNKDRNVMAPYLLQWEAIKAAKTFGCKYYDFFGINANKWPGVTRFKKGFGGIETKYPGTFDVVFDRWWYKLYNLIRKARRAI